MKNFRVTGFCFKFL